MDYNDIDYTKYLSYDNGKGVLLGKDDIEILERYNLDYTKYSNIKDLIFDLEEICDLEYVDELEELIIKFSEIYYYNYVKK